MLGEEKSKKNKTVTHPQLLETALQDLQQNDIHFFFSTMIARAISFMFPCF
jgi:hypothetical protein